MMVMFPQMVIIAMMCFTMEWSFVVHDSFMMRWRWLKVLMEEVELCFFSLCHLVRVMMLTFHGVLKLSPIRSVAKMWSSNPLFIMSIDLYPMRSCVPLFMNVCMSTIYW